MADTPKSPRPDRPDNVVRFERRTKEPDAPAAKAPLDVRRLIAGREGWVGLAVIIILAVALVAWNRLAG